MTQGNNIPPEMCVERQRMRPGSGMLTVKVVTDGPTRVLQITDIKQQVGNSGEIRYSEDYKLLVHS